MKTKEAIGWLNQVNDAYPSPYFDKIIYLLKRGEKYEAIVNEIDERLIPGELSDIKDLSTLEFVKLIIKDIKQKYFPKFKKTITFRIEAETEDKLGEAINDFEMFWADYNGVKGHNIKYSYKGGSD